MRRNPINPKEYINTTPKERYIEKLNKILDLLLKFNFSTRKLMVLRLGLNINSHHDFFKKLEEKGIIRRIKVFSIQNKHIYILTSLGKSLSYERLNGKLIIPENKVDYKKINHINLRHDLAVQKAVIQMSNQYNTFTSEKYMAPLKFNSDKKPDAFLERTGERLMLEIELTAKSDRRIFTAFKAHAEALIDKQYDKVQYIFSSMTLKNYYQSRFSKTDWPFYKQNKNGIYTSDEKKFLPDDYNNLREKFEFIANKSIVDDI